MAVLLCTMCFHNKQIALAGYEREGWMGTCVQSGIWSGGNRSQHAPHYSKLAIVSCENGHGPYGWGIYKRILSTSMLYLHRIHLHWAEGELSPYLAYIGDRLAQYVWVWGTPFPAFLLWGIPLTTPAGHTRVLPEPSAWRAEWYN